MKLGIVTNGISDDFEYALQVMQQDGLAYADLQFLWGKEIGSHTAEQNETIRRLLQQYGRKPGVITRHTFNQIPIESLSVGDPVYQEQLRQLKASLSLAKFFGTDLVRILTCNKCAVLWGAGGAEHWVTNNNRNWTNFMRILEEPVRLAEEAGVTLVMETGVFSLINNAYLARRIIDDMRSPRLKVLWDFANAAFSGEPPFPEGYEAVREHIAHIHVKDYTSPPPYMHELRNCALGQGQMAPYLEAIADALRKDHYDGIVSYESVYRPAGGTDEDGYHASIADFIRIFR